MNQSLTFTESDMQQQPASPLLKVGIAPSQQKLAESLVLELESEVDRKVLCSEIMRNIQDQTISGQAGEKNVDLEKSIVSKKALILLIIK